MAHPEADGGVLSAPAEALSLEAGRAKADRERAMERDAEVACALAFLTVADHEDCIRTPPCCRDYDPMPYPEAEPFPSDMYVGTGIAALYGGPMTARLAVELAGWNITPGRYPE